MRLYTNMKAEWFGTQADAKAAGVEWWEVNVPVDKPNLLKFLSGQSFGEPSPEAPTEIPVAHQSTAMKPHPWQSVRHMAESASLKDLGVVLAVIMNRMDELADKEVTS